MENVECRRLISLYKEYKCLWDPNDTNYTNRGVRDDAWGHIGREMDYPIEALKKKMKSLSGGYRREKFREKQSRAAGSGAGDTYKSKWFAYEDFAFLADKNDPGTARDTLQNFPETAIPETPEDEEQAGIRRRSLLPLIKRAEEIIARVYNYLQSEYEELKSSMGPSVDLSPLANILQRTAAATGISEHTVSAILEEKKRAADEDLDAGAAKRAKLSHDAGDGAASPITEEESSCQEQEDITEQDDDNEQTQDDRPVQGDYEVETLKVEIEDETYYRPADPLQSQPSESSTAEHQLPLANIANVTIKTEPVEVKIEPVDTEYTQSSCGVVPVTSLPRVKTEPDDDPSHSSTSCASAMVSATLCDVKCEPPP